MENVNVCYRYLSTNLPNYQILIAERVELLDPLLDQLTAVNSAFVLRMYSNFRLPARQNMTFGQQVSLHGVEFCD
jgi:hypothetical protein